MNTLKIDFCGHLSEEDRQNKQLCKKTAEDGLATLKTNISDSGDEQASNKITEESYPNPEDFSITVTASSPEVIAEIKAHCKDVNARVVEVTAESDPEEFGGAGIA